MTPDGYGGDFELTLSAEDIDSIELDPTDLKASHNGDYVQVYGYRIVCKEGANKNGWPGSRKTGVFSFRNDSNGYCGGSVCPVPSNFDYTKVPEIKDDVLGL